MATHISDPAPAAHVALPQSEPWQDWSKTFREWASLVMTAGFGSEGAVRQLQLRECFLSVAEKIECHMKLESEGEDDERRSKIRLVEVYSDVTVMSAEFNAILDRVARLRAS